MNAEKVRELIGQGLERDKTGAYSVQNVLDLVEAHQAELIVLKDSVAVWNVLDKPQTRTAHIWIVAGDLDELESGALPHIISKSRELGATKLTVSGRRGWIRVLRKYGMTEASTAGVMDL